MMKIFQYWDIKQSILHDWLKKKWGNKIFRVVFGGLIGAVAGWLYWDFIGCNGGSCPITSNAPRTIIIFSLFGMWYNAKK